MFSLSGVAFFMIMVVKFPTISAFDLEYALTECNNDPCHCDEAHLMCIQSTCHDDSGCNQCQDGFFKVDYNYKCVHCQQVFGDECLFCQDFNGCGQCRDGYDRVQGSISGLWHCIEHGGNDFIRVPLDEPSTFSGLRSEDEYAVLSEEQNDNYNPMRGIPSAGEIKPQTPFLDVDPAGNQYRTDFSDDYIQELLDLFTGNQENLCADCNFDEDNEENPLLDCINECINIYAGGDDGGERRRLQLGISTPDTRWEVSGTPEWRPAKHSGQLTFSGGACSAVLVGPKHILTAGHCLYDAGIDWYGGWQFWPRRTGDNPSYSIGWRRAMTWTAWANSDNNNPNWDYDLGVIELDVEFDNTGLSWVRFGYDGSLGTNDYLYHKGYPGDKPAFTMWTSAGFIGQANTHIINTFTTDAFPGQSGGPWYQYINDGGVGPVIYGIQSHTCCTNTNTNVYTFQRNGHTRINSVKFYQILDFIDDCTVDPRC